MVGNAGGGSVAVFGVIGEAILLAGDVETE
jgi:hypothetical protein